jgi:hypothetical protein
MEFNCFTKMEENLKEDVAWYDNTVLPKQMVDGALGNIPGWTRLEQSGHFGVLDELVREANPISIVDLGCGAAEVGRVYSNINYTGLDLPHIIENVAKVVNPTLQYIEFDANTSDFTIFKDFDLIICNSFISELPNPLEILNKLLTNMGRYIIIHRQYFDDSTKFTNYKTYGNLDTVRSHIGRDDFNKLLTNHIIIKEENNVFGKSLLIEKI